MQTVKLSFCVFVLFVLSSCYVREDWVPTISTWSDQYVEPYAQSPQYVVECIDCAMCCSLDCTVENNLLFCTCTEKCRESDIFDSSEGAEK